MAKSASGLEQNHFGAGRLLGHKHGALGLVLEAHLRHARPVLLDQGRLAVLAQRARQRVRHGQRAAQAELGLHEQIGQRVLGQRRQLAIPSQHARAVRHDGQAELAIGHALHLHIGRMLDDALRIAPRAVAVLQLGRVAVGGQRPFIDLAAGQGAHALQMGLQVRVHLGRQVQRQQRLQLRIGGVQVAAVAVGHGLESLGGGRLHGGQRLRFGVHGLSPVREPGPGAWAPGLGDAPILGNSPIRVKYR